MRNVVDKAPDGICAGRDVGRQRAGRTGLNVGANQPHVVRRLRKRPIPLELPRVLVERRLEVVDRRALGEGEEHKGAGELGLVLDLDRERYSLIPRRAATAQRAGGLGARGIPDDAGDDPVIW